MLLVLAVAACEKPDNTLEPDGVLRDSLGLGEEDRVHVVRLSSPRNREIIEPSSLQVRPGDYVEFVTSDRRVHAVSFVIDSLSAAGADFLRGRGQESSPPLVERQARFLVTFENAPLGRYPFAVVGNGGESRGVIVVAEPTP